MPFDLIASLNLKTLVLEDALLILTALLAAWLLVAFVRWALRHAAEKAPAHMRLLILRSVPIARLVIYSAAGIVTVTILIEPTFGNVVALIASVSLALAFALKDYVSCVVAGITVVLENTYQPGDWIEVDGAYGEVKSIDARAVHLVTVDDTEVIVPHSRLWSVSIHNATSGNRGVLCVTDLYLHPDHDAAVLRQLLTRIAESSTFRKAETPVTVIVLEEPWGTHYKVKAYATESRKQFLLVTDVTVRAKQAIRNLEIRFAQAPMAIPG